MKNRNNLMNKLFALVAFFSLTSMDFMPTLLAQNELLLTSMCSDEPASERRWRVRNHTAASIDYTYQVVGTSQNGGFTAAPGDNFFFTQTVGGPNTTIIYWNIEGNNYQTVKASGGAKCEPQEPQGCYAIEVVEFNQAKRNDGNDVLATRSDPNKALGAPENSDVATPESENNYVALGFGGSITLKMSGPIANGPGDDFRVVETTYGTMAGNCNRYPERIQAFASQDGCNWVYVGEGCQDVNLDLGPLDWALYIKLVDISPIGAAYNNQVADGYDVDGIICLNGFKENPVIQDLGADYAMEVTAFKQGKRKNGTDVVLNRSNPNQALGAPDGTDVINFVALGFGGSITLKLGYVVFDKEGDDLQIIETSFGNPACASYPERALIEVSLDNVTYFNLGEICLDGAVDFAVAGATAVQYVRITDRSMASKFGGTADGYDVDGVVVLQPGCGVEEGERVIGDNIWVADETTSFDAYPNPFKNIVNLDIVTGGDAEQMNVKVMNIAGQVVYTTNVNVASNSRINQTLELSSLTPGIYFISMETKNGVETQKLIKQ
jgi:hypothetical protein